MGLLFWILVIMALFKGGLKLAFLVAIFLIVFKAIMGY